MAAFWSLVADSRGGRVSGSDDVVHIDAGASNQVLNRTVPLRPGLDPGELAEQTHAHFAGGPGGAYGVFEPSTSRELESHGFAFVATLPQMSLARPTAPTLPVRRAQDLEDVAAAEELIRGSFTFAPWDDSSYLHALLTDPRAHVVLADVDGAPAATAVGFNDAGVTGVYLVGTRAEARGRGLGEAVTAAAGAVSDGQPAVLQASAMGAPVYSRMGYETFSAVTVWMANR